MNKDQFNKLKTKDVIYHLVSTSDDKEDQSIEKATVGEITSVGMAVHGADGIEYFIPDIDMFTDRDPLEEICLTEHPHDWFITLKDATSALIGELEPLHYFTQKDED